MLVNIAKTDDRPLYVDAASITAVHVHPEQDKVSLFNSDGVLFEGKSSDWNIDTSEVAQKLIDGGAQLLHFPTRYVAYISPAAVAYVTVSQPASDGKTGVIVAVTGLGAIGDVAITKVEIDTLLDAIRAAKPLLEYPPEKASARWSWPAALYIDPQSVTQVRDCIAQVDVYFTAAGKLDVQPGKVKFEDVVNGMVKDDPNELDTRYREIMAEARFRKETIDKQTRFDFANGLAAANGQLTAIPSPDRATHIRREDIELVSFYNGRDGEYGMFIQFQKKISEPHPERLNLGFSMTEERQRVFDLLNPVIPAQKKPAPLRGPGR